jgi:hypothetical protein
VALPALVLVLGVALAAVDLGIDQVRCVDAARSAARLLARGEDTASVRGRALAAAPEGAQFVVEAGPGTVRVTVSAPLTGRLAGWSGLSGPRAVAVAVTEDLP